MSWSKVKWFSLFIALIVILACGGGGSGTGGGGRGVLGTWIGEMPRNRQNADVIGFRAVFNNVDGNLTGTLTLTDGALVVTGPLTGKQVDENVQFSATMNQNYGFVTFNAAQTTQTSLVGTWIRNSSNGQESGTLSASPETGSTTGSTASTGGTTGGTTGGSGRATITIESTTYDGDAIFSTTGDTNDNSIPDTLIVMTSTQAPGEVFEIILFDRIPSTSTYPLKYLSDPSAIASSLFTFGGFGSNPYATANNDDFQLLSEPGPGTGSVTFTEVTTSRMTGSISGRYYNPSIPDVANVSGTFDAIP